MSFKNNLHYVTFGAIDIKINNLVKKVLKIDRYAGIAYFKNEELYGTTVLAFKKGVKRPSKKFLNSFVLVAWQALRRVYAEENSRKDLLKSQENEKLKTAFLQIISHEIRTPLIGIKGFDNLLKDKYLDNNTIREYSELIFQSADKLFHTIENIMLLSKIVTKQIEINNKTLCLNSTLHDLLNKYEVTALKQNLNLELNSLLSDEESIIMTDEIKLNQILTNLIENALKFTNDGEINIKCELIKNNIHFYIKDTGIGIPSKNEISIFDKFFQIDHSLDRAYEGSGIGLAICKGLVKLLGGKIKCKSEFGIGSTFYFTIPYNPVTIED